MKFSKQRKKNNIQTRESFKKLKFPFRITNAGQMALSCICQTILTKTFVNTFKHNLKEHYLIFKSFYSRSLFLVAVKFLSGKQKLAIFLLVAYMQFLNRYYCTFLSGQQHKCKETDACIACCHQHKCSIFANIHEYNVFTSFSYYFRF